MRFRVTGADGTELVVDAVDWMMAMCHVINHLDIEVSGWMCDTRPGGEVHVADPVHGHSWVVLPESQVGKPRPQPAPARPAVRPPAAPVPRVKSRPQPPAPEEVVTTPPPRRKRVSTPVPLQPRDEAVKPPPVDMARPASSFRPAPPVTVPPIPAEAPGPPDDLAEQLFDLSMDVSGAGSANEACKRALDVALQLVPCEAGSVVRGAINDSELTFVAASGPAANDMIGRKLSYGEGLVGVAFDLGITVVVSDVRTDPRHRSDFDAETGFQTRSVLCVPVRTTNDFYGAIELLNPPGSFEPWHVEVAESVARTLATTLDAAS